MYVRILLLLGLLAVAGFGQAQTMSHYPVGVEGIKGATLPPPGLYIRDYNYTYFKDNSPDFDLTVNTQAPRLVLITGLKFLGGNYGMDVLLPFVYQDLGVNMDLISANRGFRKTDFNLGDVFVEPITMSWHAPQFDVSLGAGVWTATGNYNPDNPVSPGKGYYTQMYTGGATYYFDKEKAWSLSALGRYERSRARRKMDVTPGQYFTVEWGLAKKIFRSVEVGTSGYYQTQVSAETGSQSTPGHDRIVGFGPEITMHCPYVNFDTSIRYAREGMGIGRPVGNMFNVTITKKIGHASN